MYSLKIGSQPFSESVSLDCKLSQCLSVFSPSLTWKAVGGLELGISLLCCLQGAGIGYFPSIWKPRVRWSWVFLSSQVSQALVKQFLLNADLLRRTECSGVFQQGSFSPPLAVSMKRFLLVIIQVFLHQHSFLLRFCSCVSALVSCDPL